MKTLTKSIGLATVAATLISACGGGGGGNASFSNSNAKITKIDLVIGQQLIVNPGDKLSGINENTEIEVEHILEKQIKSVTLLKGEATLIYGDYSLSNG